MSRAAGRLLVVVLGVLAVLTVAGPASAHVGGGTAGSDFDGRVLSVSPRLPGVSVRVLQFGDELELVNDTATEIRVPGYDDEPYLRIGPDGIFENLRSPATYLNASRKGTTSVPASADAAAPPQWRKVSDEPVARWHDHRVHWMGAQDPPTVRRDPGTTHVILPHWTVDLRQGATPVVVSGDLTWVPGPTPLPWVLLIAALVAVGLLVGRSRQWGPALSALVVLLLVVDVVHSVGIAFAAAGTTGTHLIRLLTGSLLSIPVWAVGLLAVRWLSRKDLDGTHAAAFAGIFIALLGGVSDVTVLYRSQVPFAFSISMARLLVALTIGLGGAIVAAAVTLLVRRPLDGKPPALFTSRVQTPEPTPAA